MEKQVNHIKEKVDEVIEEWDNYERPIDYTYQCMVILRDRMDEIEQKTDDEDIQKKLDEERDRLMDLQQNMVNYTC